MQTYPTMTNVVEWDCIGRSAAFLLWLPFILTALGCLAGYFHAAAMTNGCVREFFRHHQAAVVPAGAGPVLRSLLVLLLLPIVG
jgi:hypothetical protein